MLLLLFGPGGKDKIEALSLRGGEIQFGGEGDNLGLPRCRSAPLLGLPGFGKMQMAGLPGSMARNAVVAPPTAA